MKLSVNNIHLLAVPTPPPCVGKPSRAEAEEAVRTLLRWTGDDPSREGLIDTPMRVVRAFDEWFKGYKLDPAAILNCTFSEIEGYKDLVLLRDIRFESHCEHHLAPIVGRVHLAYYPHERVIGISKLARLVEAFAKRLQIQEKMTAQIANSLNQALKPQGVAVVIEAEHHCMSTRGVHQTGTTMVTKHFIGNFEENAQLRQEFLNMITVPAANSLSR